MSFLKQVKRVFSLFSPWSPKKKPRRPKIKTRKKRRTAKVKKAVRPAKKIASARKRPLKIKAAGKARRPVPKSRLRKPPKGGAQKVMVGEVTHYFDRAKAAAFMITGAPVAMGDLLEFEGKSGTFRQEVISLQINRAPVPAARAGDEVGLRVKKPVREGDYVFKLNGA